MKNPDILFCGSFNPVHIGHLKIALHLKKLKLNPVFEISRINCDKDTVSPEEASRRVFSIEKFGFDAVVTEMPYFTQKIKKYNKIAIGVDTWNRFIDPKNYFDSVELRNYTVLHCTQQCVFYIFPRPGHEFNQKEFTTGCYYQYGFEPVDISSTEIRTKNDES